MEQERLNRCLLGKTDGLISLSATPIRRTKMIEVADPAVELMDSQSPCLDIAVGFDNFEAACQMTASALSRGHRHIAYLGARLDERTITAIAGYEAAGRRAGSLQCDDGAIFIPLFRYRTHAARREYPQLDGIFAPTMTGGGRLRMPKRVK